MKSGDIFKPGQPADVVATAEGYDRWAEIYDDDFNALVELEQPLVTAMLSDVAGLDVADLGCGTGRHALRLAERGARVTALDFSSGMIERARVKPGWDELRFIEHDLSTALPLADVSFDRVLSCLVLDHIADLASFFRECRRICRPDGFIVVSTMHPAMMLRGIMAHFNDPATGRDVLPRSYPHQISDYVLAVQGAGLRFGRLSEHIVDDELAAVSPRAAKYRGWPLMLLMQLQPM